VKFCDNSINLRQKNEKATLKETFILDIKFNGIIVDGGGRNASGCFLLILNLFLTRILI